MSNKRVLKWRKNPETTDWDEGVPYSWYIEETRLDRFKAWLLKKWEGGKL